MRSASLTPGAGVEVFGFSAGSFLVDGRAMFGGTPEARSRGDGRGACGSRFPLALNCFLIRTAETLILADTGIGEWLDPRYMKAYGFSGLTAVPAALRALGFAPDDVGIVFNSHLHFDHCGGNTETGAGGRIVPAFPKARYIVQKGEWESALNPVPRDRQSYLAAGLRPLAASGRLELVDGDAEIGKGLRVFRTPGHTAFHQCLEVEAGDGAFVVAGDLVPTSAHIGLDRAMSYDLFPELTRETKRAFFDKALAGDWTLGLGHDPEFFFGRLLRPGPGIRFEALGLTFAAGID